jgi:DNA-binding transcriptional MerR regulator
VRVGEIAARAGVNIETLRYYERRGLLPKPDRAPSGHRIYDEDTVRLLRGIKEAQAVGFTLTEIEEYMKAARRTATPSEALRVRMASKIDQIDSQIAGLQRMREELARIVGCACDSLDHCTCGAGYLARGGRESTSPPTLLHVTNGESAGNTLRQTSLGGAVLPWQDVLHEGPVPAVPRPKLLDLRAKFLSECGWGTRAAIRSSLERRDTQFLEALASGTQVVLWFEHDLFDQLQLLDALALAGEKGTSLDLIVVSSFPGKPDFRGLGELTADELETLWPQRQQADPKLLEAARSAWDAVRAPEPVELAELGDHFDLSRLLEELPAPVDGLSGTERRALQAIEGGARTPADAFVAAQKLEDAPFFGDAWFYRSLSALGADENRLVETDGGPLPPAPPLSDGHVFPRLPVALTDAGLQVLAKAADRVQLLGIDRWVGGTHLELGNVWRWDPAARKLEVPGAAS